MDRREMLDWLTETDPFRLEALWRTADGVRRQYVGNEVHLRGLVEFSNHCVRSCRYCGLRAPNAKLRRYRLGAADILAAATKAVRLGCGTAVLQSGQDEGMSIEWLADVVRRIKTATNLAVTLSVGERTPDELAAWRSAGADRYLLRFETSDRELYDRIHPPLPGQTMDRPALLGVLRELGYEVGSGVMVGIPGQTWTSLARDIEQFAELDLDMIGCGPFIANPDTPLGGVPRDPAPEPTGSRPWALPADRSEQVPNDVLTACKVIALARLVRPDANIPATTALATLDPSAGYELGLTRGANVIMPNLTPPLHRGQYAIYPGKAATRDDETFHRRLLARLSAIGRRPGLGRGDRRAAAPRAAS